MCRGYVPLEEAARQSGLHPNTLRRLLREDEVFIVHPRNNVLVDFAGAAKHRALNRLVRCDSCHILPLTETKSWLNSARK